MITMISRLHPHMKQMKELDQHRQVILVLSPVLKKHHVCPTYGMPL